MSVLKIKDENEQWTSIPTIIGDAAGFGTVSASVDANHGTPSVTVTTSGTDTAKNFDFAFKNLQPAPYDDSELQADFAVLQGQFDTAVAAVTTDTEVTDIRVGADGVTDTTAGASVRRQFTDVKSDINDINSALFNYTPNVYDADSVWVNGTYSNGELVELTTGMHDAALVDYVPVSAQKDWVISYVAPSVGVTLYVVAYDTNKNYLSGIGSKYITADGYYTFETPAHTAYIRMRLYRGGNDAWDALIPSNIQVELGETPTPYKPKAKTSKLIDINADIAELNGKIMDTKRLVESDVNLLDTLIAGYLQDDGNFNTTTSGWYRSDYIPVEPNSFVYFYGINPFSLFGFYDSDKTWIGGKNIETPVVREQTMLVIHKVPSNARFIIVSLESTRAETCWGNYTPTIPTEKLIYANKNILRSYENYPTNPCDYSGMDVCTFRKGICIGDSITAGGFNHTTGTNPWADGNVYSYPSQFEKMTGIEIENQGHSGVSTVQWWNTYGAGGTNEIDFSGYDFAIIHLGINDVSQGISISDTQTAYENIINALKSANTGIKIFVCTIIPAYANPATTAYDSLNAMIATLAQAENVYLCDLTNYGHEYIESEYSAGHLTAYGYWRLAKDLIGYIGWIMRKYPSEFRFIQFIGTDMTY